MKSKISYLSSVGIAVAVCLFILPLFPQAQAQKVQGYLMTDYVVKPSMAKEFEAATIEGNGLFAGIKFPYGWTAYSTEDFHYYFFTPIETNFASIDRFSAAISEGEAQLPESSASPASRR
jgi:hypothetical protein